MQYWVSLDAAISAQALQAIQNIAANEPVAKDKFRNAGLFPLIVESISWGAKDSTSLAYEVRMLAAISNTAVTTTVCVCVHCRYCYVSL
jgi:hypothetical protein